MPTFKGQQMVIEKMMGKRQSVRCEATHKGVRLQSSFTNCYIRFKELIQKVNACKLMNLIPISQRNIKKGRMEHPRPACAT
jgi:hypothetical protein